MTERQGATSMTGRSRAPIAAFGFVVLVVVAFGDLAAAGLASLCRLSGNATATCHSAPPSVVLLLLAHSGSVGAAVVPGSAGLIP